MSGTTDDCCPCCGKLMRIGDPEEPPFCWDCGLYVHDSRFDCDDPDHRNTITNR